MNPSVLLKEPALLLVQIAVSAGIGYWATTYNRRGWLWGGISLVSYPLTLFVAIALFEMGEAGSEESTESREN